MKIIHRRMTRLAAAVAAVLAVASLTACGSAEGSAPGSESGDTTIGIVELNLSNPFFATLEKATESAATKHGWKVMKAEAKQPGDSATQIRAIENMINNDVKAIVLDPANPTALVDVVKKARDAGVLVITVNATLDPITAADATFATDNHEAGVLIGKWAKAAGPKDPKIAMLDFDLSDGPSHGRHFGFLDGYGIKEGSSEIVGTALTQGTVETGQTEMENLASAHPDINLVYTINEPTAHGAAAALEAAGIKDATIVSVDGACTGVKDVANGTIGATSMQFPSKMGELAVDAIAKYLKDGTKPKAGLNNSGVTLITDDPVEGLDSQTSTWGLEHCWGSK